MSQTKLGEKTVNTNGTLPGVGTEAPDFIMTGTDLKDVALKNFRGKKVVLNIFPSIDTSVCATSVREFNKRAASLTDTVVLCISKDLPFAMRRFCGAEGIDKVIMLSDFKNNGFSKTYGIEMIDGGMTGFFARALLVLDVNGIVKHVELVPAIGQEPGYDAALKAL